MIEAYDLEVFTPIALQAGVFFAGKTRLKVNVSEISNAFSRIKCY